MIENTVFGIIFFIFTNIIKWQIAFKQQTVNTEQMPQISYYTHAFKQTILSKANELLQSYSHFLHSLEGFFSLLRTAV